MRHSLFVRRACSARFAADAARAAAKAAAFIAPALLAGCAYSPPGGAAPPAAGPAVSGNGFTLVSERIVIPPDSARLPDGPGVRLVFANCMSCHSASMLLTQPALSDQQWTGIVEKMRATYHAPVAESDVSAITAYLGTLHQGDPEDGNTTR